MRIKTGLLPYRAGKIFFLIQAVFVFLLIFLPNPSGAYEPPETPERAVYKKRLKAVVMENMKQTEAYMEKANMFVEQQDFDKAVNILKKASRGAPYDPRPYYFLVDLYWKLGREDEGLKTLEEAAHIHTDNNFIFDHLKDWIPSPPPERETKTLARVSVAPFQGDKFCAVTFTFDDGPRYIYKKVLPMFDSLGFKATIPVNPGIIPTKKENIWWGTWGEWKDAHERGHEIANHSTHHRDLTLLSPEELDADINGAYDEIKERIGTAPSTFVLPFDQSTPAVLKKAAQRHKGIRHHGTLTQIYGKIFIPVYGGKYFSSETARQILYLAMAKRLWLIAECHSIDSKDIKTYKPVTEEFLHTHLQDIKKNEDKIWLGTFRDVYQYLYERKTARLTWQETGEKGLKVTLECPRGDVCPAPLTLVVNTYPRQPQKARAYLEGFLVELPVTIRKNKILVEAVPGMFPVRIAWE